MATSTAQPHPWSRLCRQIGPVFFRPRQRGDLYITFEEGTWAAWLYDLLKPHATKVVVCNPRKNALLKEGSKSDKIDARKLAELLRGGYLRPVYHEKMAYAR